jgi:hypothetical protein
VALPPLPVQVST